MGDLEARQRWLTPRTIAEIWWCGDDWCDCTQPQIVRITPNHKGGYPWVHREALWTGKFLTATDEYTAEEIRHLQYEPLREECHRIGIPVPKQLVQHLAGPAGKLP